MSKEQIESTDWLTRDIPKEQLERKKQEAVMSADLALCHTEFATGVGEIYTDYDTTAQKMFAKGYRKQSEWISVEERLPEDDGAVCGIVRGKHRNVELCDAIELVCYFADEGIWALWDDARVTIQVTHWIPLPEPPKMKGGE